MCAVCSCADVCPCSLTSSSLTNMYMCAHVAQRVLGLHRNLQNSGTSSAGGRKVQPVCPSKRFVALTSRHVLTLPDNSLSEARALTTLICATRLRWWQASCKFVECCNSIGECGLACGIPKPCVSVLGIRYMCLHMTTTM